jgi:hypothetical protein
MIDCIRPAVLGSVPILLVEDGTVNEDELARAWPGKIVHFHGSPPVVLRVHDQTAVVADLEQLIAGH